MFQRIITTAFIAGMLIHFSIGEAYAHRSPGNCGGSGIQLLIFQFRLDGSTASIITNGEKVRYVVMADNATQLPTAGGNVPVCDVSCASVVLKTADSNGNATVMTTVATNVNLPFGTPQFVAGIVTSIVAVAGTSLARFSASASGVSHDTTLPGCTPDGTCVTNACDPTPAFAERSGSLFVTRPALKVFAQCVSATNNGSSMIFTLAGSVTNSGDEALSNISIVSDKPPPGTVLTNIASLAAGASVNFSATNTTTNYFCPILATTITASGHGTHSLGVVSAQDTCEIPISARLQLHTPVLHANGNVDLAGDCPRGWHYLIQASSNLANWTLVTSNVAASSIINHLDTNALGARSRFYRIQTICPD